jgi:uncharacterized protein (DUF111 family)
MQALIFDPFSGASGDMIIASLVDLGADATVVRELMSRFLLVVYQNAVLVLLM